MIRPRQTYLVFIFNSVKKNLRNSLIFKNISRRISGQIFRLELDINHKIDAYGGNEKETNQTVL